MDHLTEIIPGHGFDTDTLLPYSQLDEETFVDKLKYFLLSERSDID